MDTSPAHASQALFGTETEYAVTAFDAAGRVLPVEGVADKLLAHAAARPSLFGGEPGFFLSNGARFYVDGSHPEYASPETTNPWDAVRYALAGDSLMSQLADEVTCDHPEIASVVVRKGNVDYAGPTTFASHENYLHSRPPAELRPALVPHLISRIVFTGAGGFDPFDGKRARFVLSPRALFTRQRLVATSVHGDLALVDDRTQPLCDGFHRQHLVCGDANRSHLSLFLRLGSTALVAALIDADCAGTDDVALAEPLQALGTIARDVTLRQRVALTSDEQVTALDIQRHFLRQARLHRERLPTWSDAVCDVWEDTLDRLARGPDAVADRLDWAIKRAIYQDRAARRRRGRLSASSWAGETGALFPQKLTARWRAGLCEIDLRFGQVYPPSLFDELDQAGVMRHRVEGIVSLEQAVSVPPADGRARIRGEVVARLADQRPWAVCDWDRIWDFISQQWLDLTSPFTEAEVWRDFNPRPSGSAPLVTRLALLATGRPSPVATRSIRSVAEALTAWTPQDWERARLTGQDAIQINNDAILVRSAGRLEDAEWLMRAALAIDIAGGEATHRKLPHRRNNLGTVLLIQGRAADARQEVTMAWHDAGMRYDLTSARVLTMRLTIALVDGEPEDVFLGQLKTHLAIQPLPDFADVNPLWQVTLLLEALTPKLDANALDLLRAIADVLNGNRQVESLEELACWRDAPPLPLDAPWPCEVHA